MKSRKRLWLGLGALCALAISAGWLTRRDDADELDALQALRPDGWEFYKDDQENSHWQMRYNHVPAAQIVDAVGIGRGRIHATHYGSVAVCWMSSGRMLSVLEYPATWTDVQVYQPRAQPWFERAWLSLRFHCGAPKEE